MQRLIILLAVFAALLLGGSTVAASEPRIINVTTDSAPGWTPSVEMERAAILTARNYLADMDAGRYGKAYAALDVLNRQETLEAFSARLKAFNARAGPVVQRTIVKVTWTKDPQQAPAPGIYVAIDLASRFANIDRHCGYLVLYQPPAGGDFHVAREEDNFMDNATAAEIAKQGSSAGVDAAWTRVSANCPNHSAAPAPPLAEAPQSSIGYPTVEAALSDLRAKPGVAISVQHGWTIADDRAAMTIWSFPPPGDPAYPAAVKRQIIQTGAGVEVSMTIMCGSSKTACDNLVRQFQQLNAQMKGSLQPKS